ncbi:hypothetical protein M3210_16730 [Oceanobacillus luteolus]|uniref:Lipoprotein n=1 Tax=Oceanobacillus luteolus TaxID=1274358 RepID=A0ABW4HVK0_9BACI|nr:hypothetical protein [Oceanobacillus luteolus]MCM3741900.1 hypothetical protein [Oceanobacillus luteolus]
MKFKKIFGSAFVAILSTGLLFGCGTANDEQEPDPTEEPSEQMEDRQDNQ